MMNWMASFVLGKLPVGQVIIHCTVPSQRHSVGIIAVYSYMSLSENSVPLFTQWFCWSLSLWKMAISLGILTQHFQTNPYDHHTHTLGMSFAKDVLKLQIFAEGFFTAPPRPQGVPSIPGSTPIIPHLIIDDFIWCSHSNLHDLHFEGIYLNGMFWFKHGYTVTPLDLHNADDHCFESAKISSVITIWRSNPVPYVPW